MYICSSGGLSCQNFYLDPGLNRNIFKICTFLSGNMHLNFSSVVCPPSWTRERWLGEGVHWRPCLPLETLDSLMVVNQYRYERITSRINKGKYGEKRTAPFWLHKICLVIGDQISSESMYLWKKKTREILSRMKNITNRPCRCDVWVGIGIEKYVYYIQVTSDILGRASQHF